MHNISKNAIVPYSDKQMFNLVNEIDKYPEFLNWCSSSSILNQSEKEIIASIEINKSGIKQSFTTKNYIEPFKTIKMQLLKGPFKHLTGQWRFQSLENNMTKISLDLQFSFQSKLMDISLAPIFSQIAGSQLDAFIVRAKQIYK